MGKIKILIASIACIFFAAGCVSKDQVKKTLVDNPDILVEAINKNPKEIIEALNTAAQAARAKTQEQAQVDEAKKLEEEFKNPKKPVINEKRAIFGPKSAPITIVEYSDFECPFCTRGYNTVNEVKKAYGDKVRVLYKHLPLDFHPMAMPAAKYYEAIALQSAEKAEKFHDLLFENQKKLTSEKEKFLDASAKKVGANLAKVKKDLDSDEVTKRIAEDKAEAAKFGFTGTPGFLINGVSLKGAYPFPNFKTIIDKHLSK